MSQGRIRKNKLYDQDIHIYGKIVMQQIKSTDTNLKKLALGLHKTCQRMQSYQAVNNATDFCQLPFGNA